MSEDTVKILEAIKRLQEHVDNRFNEIENRIADIKFKTFGCCSAIATSSMITELAKGKTLDEALKINRADVADSLGGLPPFKAHCSNLAANGLHEAIRDYHEKREEE